MPTKRRGVDVGQVLIEESIAANIGTLNELCQKHGIGVVGESVTEAIIQFIEKHSAPVNPEPPPVSIVWYPQAELVYRAYWEPVAADNGMTYEDIADGIMTGFDKDGNEVESTAFDDVEGIKRMGCWGWVDTEKHIIHAWAAPDAEPCGVLHMLAHEIGHITGVAHPDGLQEEFRAEQFGRVASIAYRLMQQRQT